MAKAKIVTVGIILTLTEEEYTRLLQNSIERIMNNAIYVGGISQTESTSEGIRERGSTLWQDCEELKPLVTKLWGAVQEAVRKELLDG